MFGRGHQPALTVQLSWRSHAATLVVSGDIDFNTACLLSRHVRGVLPVRPQHLVIDLSGVRYVDAAGCRMLARAARELAPGQLVLSSPSRSARRIFQVTGLDRLCRLDPAAAVPPARATSPFPAA